MNSQMMTLFGNQQTVQNFDEIKISMASPEQIRSWSFGEVKKPETINYRTFQAQKKTVCSARVFLDQSKITSVSAANTNA